MCSQKTLYLASRFNSFPHAEVNNDPGCYETQHQLIADVPRLVQPTRQTENFTSRKTQNTKGHPLDRNKKSFRTSQTESKIM